MKEEKLIVEGLVVEVHQEELHDRFETYAEKCEEMARKIEVTMENQKDAAVFQVPDWVDVDMDERPARVKKQIMRSATKLREAANSARFIAGHLVTGATYRLDAEGAAQLVQSTIPSEDSLMDVFPFRRWRVR